MATKDHKPSQLGNGESDLDKEVEHLVGKGPDGYSPADWTSLREHLRLQALHAGEYVAWRDHFEKRGSERRLVRREVLCASARSSVVRKFLGALSDQELADVFMDYIERPDELPIGR
jgi:hypothetical protein